MSRLSQAQRIAVVATLAIVGITLISGGCKVSEVIPTMHFPEGMGGDQVGGTYSYTDWGQTFAFILGVLIVGGTVTLALGWRKKPVNPTPEVPRGEQGRKVE
jgi:hypothetical protein